MVGTLSLEYNNVIWCIQNNYLISVCTGQSTLMLFVCNTCPHVYIIACVTTHEFEARGVTCSRYSFYETHALPRAQIARVATCFKLVRCHTIKNTHVLPRALSHTSSCVYSRNLLLSAVLKLDMFFWLWDRVLYLQYEDFFSF
jgi:hypothetical protein